jgi:ABC-type oligopeptide transport system substrate-binding subunit
MAGDQQPETNSSISNRLSRRKVLALTSAASVGLAGCGGDGGDETTAADTPTEAGTPMDTPAPADTDSPTPTEEPTTVQQQGEQMRDSIRSHVGSWQPSNTNLNRFAPAGNEPPWLAEAWFPMTKYRNNKGEHVWWVFQDATFSDGGTTIEWQMSEDYTWWDGSAVTAEDYVTQLKINQYQGAGSPEEAAETFTAVDDYTIREERGSPVNPQARLLNQTDPIHAKRDIFGEWLERYEDAGGSDAVDQVTQNLAQLQIEFQDAVDQGYGGGMFMPTQWNPNTVTWEKYEDHPRADWTNLSGWEWVLVSGDQKLDQAFQNDQFDMGELQFDLVAQKDDIENIAEVSLPGVPKLTINYDNKHLGRRAVRQAIAYIIDHDEIREVLRANFGTPYQPHPYINGMASPVGNNWLGTGYQESMNDYGATAQPDKARQVLQDAGYSKDGDYWVDEDGDAINNLTYISPPWSIYQQIEQYLSPRLNEFGIGNEQVLPSRSNFYKRLNDTYEFDLLNWYHFGFHPTVSYFVGTGTPIGFDNYTDVAEPVDDVRTEPELTNDTSPRLKHTIRAEMPSEVGDNAMEGETETVKPIMWNNIMGSTQDNEEIVSLARKLAWYYNWQVPHIGFYEEIWNYWGRTSDFSFRGNHPDTETDRTAREHTIPNNDQFQVTGGHVSSKYE